MRLKQFLVHCPYVHNEGILLQIMQKHHVDRSEAKKIDYQQRHKEKAIKVRDYTRCITP